MTSRPPTAAHGPHDPRAPGEGRVIVLLSAALGAALLGAGLALGPLEETGQGMGKILLSPCALITDYIALGGMGAAFANAGLVTLYSAGLLWLFRPACTGASLAAVFLMAGFSLFGKNLLNIQPIIGGVFLFARWQGQRFARYLNVALFGTTLAPLVSEIAFAMHLPPAAGVPLAVATGVAAGFVLPAVSSFTVRVHQGYNLYNVGFAAGVVATLAVSMLKAFGINPSVNQLWSSGNNRLLGVMLGALFLALFGLGYLLGGRQWRPLLRVARHSGRAVADFVVMDGLPATLMNMAAVGALATAALLLVGGQLNGPTLGGIFCVAGFGAYGKHPRNILPVMAGVVLGGLLHWWDFSLPAAQLALLFGTGLAPVSGRFGWGMGVAAGFIHAAAVLCVGTLYSGLNLYNNGFSAGFVTMVMIPVIEAVRKDQDE